MAQTEEPTVEINRISLTGLDIRDRAEAPVLFVNQTIIVSSPDEVLIDFGVKLPDAPAVVNVKARILMTPVHAKQLLEVLKAQLDQYENALGNIETDLTKRIKPGVLESLPEKK